MRLDHYIRDTYKLTGNKAQQLIKEGYVTVDKLLIQKPAYDVSGIESIALREEKRIHWVSRSAGKLDGFLEKTLGLSIAGTRCLDVGSSTGGFSQVLLERGAAHIDAVDVGTDQLHEILRHDARVTSYEQTDIRDFGNLLEKGGGTRLASDGGLEKSETPIPPTPLSQGGPNQYDIIVCDASFISLTEILSSILSLANSHTYIILLWKPQFEVGRENLQPKGVPKDEKIVIKKMREWEDFLAENNCKISQKEKSTVIGEAGNEEWLYLIKKQ